MSKKRNYKSYALYFLLGLVIMFVFSYICFSFVVADFNAMNWDREVRGGYVFSLISIFILSLPITGLILNEIE